MKKKLQVFISSTYEDLIKERQAAVEAVLSADHIPAGMELFSAGDESQMETIHKWIDDSDVFLLILGGRYGSIEPKSGKSYTQLEYEYASKNGMPIACVYMSESYLDARLKDESKSVLELKNPSLFETFKQIVMKKICRKFDNIDQLKLGVMHSLSRINQDRPDLIGWVKSSEVVDTKVILEQMTHLQSENQKLNSEIQQLRKTRDHIASLSEDAKNILLKAASAPNEIQGYIYRNEHSIESGAVELNNTSSHREQTRWDKALNELLKSELVVHKGRNTYCLTWEGYEMADRLSAPKTNDDKTPNPN